MVILRTFGVPEAFGEGVGYVGAVVLYAEVFDLFVDGLDVFVDLALVAEAFSDCFGEEFVGRIVAEGDLTQRLGIARQGFDVADAQLHRGGLWWRATVVMMAVMVAGMVMMRTVGDLQEGHPGFLGRGEGY